MADAPGQRARSTFPRFGLPPYADRFPVRVDERSFAVSVNGVDAGRFDLADRSNRRVNRQSDFHCVTTWTFRDAKWGGVSFAEFYNDHVRSQVDAGQPIVGAILRAQDGYKTSMFLEDLLHESVLLADELDGQPLGIEHGAPLRLVAPAHYGYKNLKHIDRIDFFSELPTIKRGVRAFLDHPRARVRFEERGQWFPGWLLRYVYRPFIGRTARTFAEAMEGHQKGSVND